MESVLMAETLTAVPDIDPLQDRIDALEAGVKLHPAITFDRLAKAAGLSYQTWRNLLTGKSRSEKTVRAFERALADLIEHPEDIAEEPTHVVASSADDLIEIDLDISGDFGVQARAIVKGPVSNPEAVAEAAAKILERIRGSRREASDE